MSARLLGLLLALGACGPGARQELAARPEPATSAIAEIVRLEGARTGGARLLELARGGAPSVRARALLALGRQGDPDHLPVLAAGLDDAAVADAAAEALGLVGAPTSAPALVGALAVRPSPALAAALGRCGADADAARVLARLLGASEATLRAAGARALGALGQRKQPVPDDVLAALAGAASDADAEVRYAVAYALFRAPAEELPADARAALVALALDAAPETRAIAVRGLAVHHASGERVVAAGLADVDWRVRVQAVRALTAEQSPAEAHGLVASWTAREMAAAQTDASIWVGPRAHALLEALTRLAPFAAEPEVARLFATAQTALASAALLRGATEANIAISTADCLILVGRVRAQKAMPADVVDCGGARDTGYPVHERKRLALALVGARRFIPDEAALGLLESGWRDADARVRGAAVEAAVAFLPEPRAATLVAAALGAEEPLVVGSAADALATRLAAPAPPAAAELLALAATRLAGTRDPEVALGLVGALCAAPARDYLPALQAAHTSPSAVVRTAARECIAKLVGTDPGPGVATASAASTPADPVRLLGRRVVWTVTTTRGELVLELDPDLAPWNVATLTALAEKGFYDGTLWHRVVSDFVVQGGDPTGSGWGGPGYTVPTEASSRRYLRGSIGIADAGKDTGGSQWFVMHSASPHLEQRYTIVGQVRSGMEVVDRLHVGDRVVRVKVAVGPRTP